jgi:hypothetical protein
VFFASHPVHSIPAAWRNGMTKQSLQQQLLETPFVQSFVSVYQKLKGFRLRRQHLSMFAAHFPYKTTTRLFGIGRKAVYLAKVQAGAYGGARPVPPSLTSFRVSPEATLGVNAFVSRPEITQVLASAPGAHSTPISELTLKREAAWRRYDAATPAGKSKVGRTSFLNYINQPCFRMQRSVFAAHPLSALHDIFFYITPPCLHTQVFLHHSPPPPTPPSLTPPCPSPPPLSPPPPFTL